MATLVELAKNGKKDERFDGILLDSQSLQMSAY